MTLPRLSLGRSLLALADAGWRAPASVPPPLVGQAWWPETQLLTARETAGSSEGLFLSVKGGHNDESHNHNDVGSVLVAVDGHPALVDAGVSHYTREHFGPRRYEIWTMRSDYHNVPSVDGFEQLAGADHRARDVSAELTSERAGRLDLAGAYDRGAGIVRWWREVFLERRDAGGAARIRWHDDWELDHDPESVVLHLLASAEPDSGQPGRLLVPVPARALRIDYDSTAFDSPAIERIPLDDRRLRRAWGDALWRITLAARAPGRQGAWALDLRAAGGSE